MKAMSWVMFSWIFVIAIPVAAQSSRIYVLNNKGGPSIDVIDPATNTIVQTIDGIPGAHGATFSADGRLAYITSETQDTLYAVDTATGKILRKLVLSDGSPDLLALTNGGRRLFICINGLRDAQGLMQSQRPSVLDVIDTGSFTVTKSIPEKGGMHDCYSTPDGKYVIAGSTGGKFLQVVDAETEQPLWEVHLGHEVTTTAQELGPDGSPRLLFTPIGGFRGFSVIDFANHKELTRIQLPDEPSGVLLGKPLERRNTAPTHGDTVSLDGKTLWVCSRGSNGVFVYSLPELKVIKFIPTPRVEGASAPANGGDPSWITFTPDGETVYVANSAADSVSVINAKTMKQVAVIPVGRQPDHVFTLVLPSAKWPGGLLPSAGPLAPSRTSWIRGSSSQGGN
jgi:YVTN family beta-propeller protein